MTIAALTYAGRRELAHRSTGGIEITLYWHVRDNSTSIDVRHMETEETFSFFVPPERALDAFHHPFVHIGLEGSRP